MGELAPGWRVQGHTTEAVRAAGPRVCWPLRSRLGGVRRWTASTLGFTDR